MSLIEIIKHYLPNLEKADYVETVGSFHLFKITRGSDHRSRYVCLYEIDDYAPDPLESLGNMGGIEDSLGMAVEGCFVVGSGEIVEIEKLENDPAICKRRDFYFYHKDRQAEAGQGYLLYALL